MPSAGATLCAARDEHEHLPFCLDGFRLLHCLPESITIYLVVPGLSVMPMRVMESDSIASVKLRIQICKGFVVKKQKLVFDGRELARNHCLIRDYGVCNGNTLHLVIRISDLRSSTVKTLHAKKFKFHVEPGRTVAYVKQQIAKSRVDPVHPNDQRLVFEGEDLDDRHLIHDICRSDNAVIHLLVQGSAKVRTKPVAKDFELSIFAPTAEEKNQLLELQIPTRKSLDQDFWIEPVIVNPKAELPYVLRNLIGTVFAGLENGNSPIMSSEGTGGAYFMQDASGREHIAVFKPTDEEPMAVNNPRGLPVSSNGEGLKKGTKVGEGAFREVAAYILDHPLGGRRSCMEHGIGFAGVPPTTLVRCLLPGVKQSEGNQKALKLGSLQAFVKNCGSSEDMGPHVFPVQEVHKICVLDIRLGNADRHAGNILVCKDEGHFSLVPIDHGYCLPESFEDCTFEWLYWPQSHEPFSHHTVQYIKTLDAEEDIAILKFYGWEISAVCARTLRITTMLLKKGVERGLTAYDIGSILCRETVKKQSKIEEIIREAEDGELPGASEAAFLESVSEIMDRHLDELPNQK